MFLKRFLWFLSFSVFLAGVIYYFMSYDRAPKRPDARAALTGDLFIRSHKPDERIISGLVSRNSTFWYLTVADRAVTGDILAGTSLASRMNWDEPGPVLPAEVRPVAALGLDLEARADRGGTEGLR